MTTFLSRVNRRLLLKRKATLQHHLSDRSSQARPDDFDRRRPDVNRAGIETTSKGGRVDVSAAQNYDHRDRRARGLDAERVQCARSLGVLLGFSRNCRVALMGS